MNVVGYFDKHFSKQKTRLKQYKSISYNNIKKTFDKPFNKRMTNKSQLTRKKRKKRIIFIAKIKNKKIALYGYFSYIRI